MCNDAWSIVRKSRTYSVLALVVTCAGLAPWVRTGAQQPSASIDTPIAGVSAFVHPPPDFDPLIASDADLDRFGFPPRPSAEEGADMVAQWERRAKTQTRIVPQLVQGGKFHGPVRSIKTDQDRVRCNRSK